MTEDLKKFLLLAGFIFFIVAADAARDAVMCIWDWLPRHVIKWVAFYPPLLYVLWKERLRWKAILLLALVSTLIHRIIYHIFERMAGL